MDLLIHAIFLQLFIGQKYGEPHIPVDIDVTEMEKIRTCLLSAGSDITVLDKWYQKNMNGTPEIYRLRDIYGKTVVI